LKNKPQIELIPERPLLVAGKEQTTDVLIRITPPDISAESKRPRLNLSIVLDRSGSMEGEKMAYARQAAADCVDQLLPQDRVSVVIFDDVIELIVPSQTAENREAIKERLQNIRARNSTALHEAWVRGGLEVSKYLADEAINRALLITDGLANVGETNTDRIVSQAAELAARGVTTSTIGIGRDFNEDLLIPMAEAGRGNAWHVEKPADMERIFATEMEGLIAQLGDTVSLGLTPADGVKVQDVMNDFEVTHTGRYKLPNLRAGSVMDVVVRLKTPARSAGRRDKLFDVRLAWNPQDGSGQEREVLTESLTVEYAEARAVEQLAIDERVIKAVQILMTARARREAMAYLDRGDVAGATAVVTGSLQQMAMACAPMMADQEVQEQMHIFEDLAFDLENRQDLGMTRKKMSYQSYQLGRQSKSLKKS
jgi:Ca-activated chloride channel family protein